MSTVDQTARSRATGPRSQSQQSPSGPASRALETWAQLVRHQLASVQAFWDELASLEAASYRRWRSATEHLAQVRSDSVADLSALAAELRQLGLAMTAKLRAALQPH